MDNTPFLIPDIDAMRAEVLALDAQTGKRADLWRLLRSSARSNPDGFGWFTPFVALMTRETQDIENARGIVFTYLSKLEDMDFCSGLQFHFWCFAFPHAKVSLYFQWLCTIGAFSAEEQREIAARLAGYHFLNFYYGMRTKPEPECVDNQTLSLTLSSTLVGRLFAQEPGVERMAALMLRDGLRRLPTVIGEMPPSGYSGEGSAYMDCVNGPAIPLAIEVLEAITGERDLLHKPFPPGNARPIRVLEMVARAFMPGGLLLPWDNYGYQLGVRSAVAYAARKTGRSLFRRVLQEECTITYDIGIGWAYDDLVWTLIWWPGDGDAPQEDGEINWYAPEVGGTLVSRDSTLYALQMWDESACDIPARQHVNPNALLFNAYGVPLSADGSPTPNQGHRFQFADTWREVQLFIGEPFRYNFGDGCGGAHSIVLVDGKESLRAHGEYAQIARAAYDTEHRAVWADATPLYRENFPDVQLVSRKTQLHHDAFFTVEDCFQADASHAVTSRFLLRPGSMECTSGVHIETAEGVSLHLFDLLHPGPACVEAVEHHPYLPDDGSILADFTSEGNRVRRLFVAFMAHAFAFPTRLEGWTAAPDPEAAFSPDLARVQLAKSTLVLPMLLPPSMERTLPPSRTWWYHKRMQRSPGPAAFKLPAGLFSAYGAPFAPRFFLNGQEIDLAPFRISGQLIAPRITLPTELEHCTELDLLLRADVPLGHYDGKSDGTIGMWGGIWLGAPVEPERVLRAEYREGCIQLETTRRSFSIPYALGGEPL